MTRSLAGRRRIEATALPSWIKPQLTKLVDQPPDGSEWLHEIKFDGYRMHESNMAEGTSQGLTLAIDAPLAITSTLICRKSDESSKTSPAWVPYCGFDPFPFEHPVRHGTREETSKREGARRASDSAT